MEWNDLPIALMDVTGLIPDEQGLVLARLAHDVDAAHAIVELGSFKGKSTCFLAAGAQAGRGAHVYAFDAWDLPTNPTGRHGYATAREAFDAHVASCGLTEHITPTRSFSVPAGEAWDGPPVGLLYIDADHGYQAVLDDFWTWWPHLIPGAVVAFDDWRTPKNPGVEKAVSRLEKYGHIRDVRIEVERLAVAVTK